MKADLPANEVQRLAVLRNYNVLDTAPESGFDDLALLASQIFQTPIALVSLVDETRQWFKARVGLDARETPRDAAFCAHAILDSKVVLEVRDAQLDQRFADNPLVTADPHIRFYAGAPLVTTDGYALGTLCVIDYKPHHLSDSQKLALQALSRHVVTLLELRRSLTENKKIADEFLESEARFRDLVENANDLIQICGMDGTILYANRAWCDSLGYSEAEIPSLTLRDIIHPDSLEHCMALFQQVIAEKKLLHMEAAFRTKDGQKIIIEGNSSCRTQNGLPFSTRSIFRDVTQRRQAELELKKLQLHRERILVSIGEGLHGIDRDGKIIFENPAAITMLGYTGGQALLGQPAHAVIHHTRADGSPYPENECHINATLHDGVTRRVEDEVFWRKDGTSFPVTYISTPMIDAAGNIEGSIVAFQDITARKKIQLALEQFKYTLDQTVDCVFICNTDDFRFEYVNEGAKRQVGYSETELLEMIVPDIKPEYSPEQYRVLVQPLLDGSKPSLIFETTHKHKDGHDIQVEITMQAVHQGALKPRLIAVVRDITERKRVEQLLRAKNAELKGFAYTVSHDLKAPLRGISGYAQELERRHKEGLTERAQFCITQIITASHNLDGLIEDLLAYSRVDSETLTITEVNLSVLLNSIMQDRSHTIAEQGVEVKVDVPAITMKVWERGLHQVLTNLIDNAIKYSRNAKPPRLFISAEETPAGCLVTVKDNGIGFDMKYHDRIFGLFNRLVRADEFEGTGAGLAIVKKLVEKLGGSIRAESAPGEGATFFVELPNSPTTQSLS